MKVMLLNGSPRADGNTNLALNEIAKVLNESGIEAGKSAGIAVPTAERGSITNFIR